MKNKHFSCLSSSLVFFGGYSTLKWRGPVLLFICENRRTSDIISARRREVLRKQWEVTRCHDSTFTRSRKSWNFIFMHWRNTKLLSINFMSSWFSSRSTLNLNFMFNKMWIHKIMQRYKLLCTSSAWKYVNQLKGESTWRFLVEITSD